MTRSNQGPDKSLKDRRRLTQAEPTSSQSQQVTQRAIQTAPLARSAICR
jgi:hypothetical protein